MNQLSPEGSRSLQTIRALIAAANAALEDIPDELTRVLNTQLTPLRDLDAEIRALANEPNHESVDAALLAHYDLVAAIEEVRANLKAAATRIEGLPATLLEAKKSLWASVGEVGHAITRPKHNRTAEK